MKRDTDKKVNRTPSRQRSSQRLADLYKPRQRPRTLRGLTNLLAQVVLDPPAFIEHLHDLRFDARNAGRSLPKARLNAAISAGLTVLSADEISIVLYEDYKALQALRKAALT